MMPSDMVKASVVDIRPQNSPLPTNVVVDANVLYVIGYDFSSLAATGAKLPSPDQTRFYPAWWKRAVEGNVNLCTTAGVLAEVAHIVERTELEVVWRTDPQRPELDPGRSGQDFTPKYVKLVRYHYLSQLQIIRENVEITLRAIWKLVNVMPQLGQDAQALERTLAQWLPSAADVGDASLVASAKRTGMILILSDDADLVSFEGITVYTANRNAIEAARRAGKLES